MSAWRRLFRRRPYALAAAGVLMVLMAGDRAQLAPPPGVGIDPFEVLDQQVRNNVLIVFDTSGSMKWPVDRDNFTLGGDDPGSRMYQAAIKVMVANRRGVLAKVASEIAEAGSNIDSISMDEDRAVFTNMHFVLEVQNRQHLARVMRALRRLPDVQKISRVRE